jgi:hypothetical protein
MDAGLFGFEESAHGCLIIPFAIGSVIAHQLDLFLQRGNAKRFINFGD